MLALYVLTCLLILLFLCLPVEYSDVVLFSAGRVGNTEGLGLEALGVKCNQRGYVVTDKKIAENPGQIKRWVRAMVRSLMFLRDRPEESAAIGIKKLQLGNINRAMLIDATKAYTRAFVAGVPGVPSPEGIKNILEYEIRVPMKMAEPMPAQRALDLRFVEEVKKELEQKGLGK